MTEDIRLRQHRRAALVADLIIAAAVGLLALVLLAPTTSSGEPPRCSSAFAYDVPCAWGWSYGGAALAVAVTSALLLGARRRRPT